MSKSRRAPRWFLIVAILSGGLLFQTVGAGCNQLAADLTYSWSTSIANNFISSWMSQRFRVPTFTFGGLTT